MQCCLSAHTDSPVLCKSCQALYYSLLCNFSIFFKDCFLTTVQLLIHFFAKRIIALIFAWQYDCISSFGGSWMSSTDFSGGPESLKTTEFNLFCIHVNNCMYCSSPHVFVGQNKSSTCLHYSWSACILYQLLHWSSQRTIFIR